MRLGVDLGGTKIEIIALEEDGKVLLRERVATPQGDYAATLEAIAGLVRCGRGRVWVARICRSALVRPARSRVRRDC